jgi:hypothetical protein
MLAAGVALVALIVFAIYMRNKWEGFEGDSKVVTFYWMDGCGHCVSFEPEWATFNEELPAGVTTKKVESKNAPTDIKGFPTITVQKGNAPAITYTGDRTSAAIKDFLKNT